MANQRGDESVSGERAGEYRHSDTYALDDDEKKRPRKRETARKKTGRNDEKKIETENAVVRYKSQMTRNEAILHLEEVLSGLKNGLIHYRQGADAVCIAPSELVDVVMKAKRRKRKESIAFRISWRTPKRKN